MVLNAGTAKANSSRVNISPTIIRVVRSAFMVCTLNITVKVNSSLALAEANRIFSHGLLVNCISQCGQHKHSQAGYKTGKFKDGLFNCPFRHPSPESETFAQTRLSVFAHRASAYHTGRQTSKLAALNEEAINSDTLDRSEAQISLS